MPLTKQVVMIFVKLLLRSKIQLRIRIRKPLVQICTAKLQKTYNKLVGLRRELLVLWWGTFEYKPHGPNL